MTIRNTTLKITVPVELTYLEGMLEKRNKIPGDLLIVRSKFSVRRDDFGILLEVRTNLPMKLIYRLILLELLPFNINFYPTRDFNLSPQ